MRDQTTQPPGPDEVSVVMEGQEWRFWNDIELHLSLDNHATVGFTVPFDSDPGSAFRKTFVPCSYKPMDVLIGGNKCFTGELIDVVPRVTPDSRIADITGYSRPAKLAKYDLPPDAVPTQMRGLNIRQIAEKLCSYYDIEVFAPDTTGAVFKKVKVPKGTKVQPFLVDLAQQRGLVISSTAEGKLRLWRSVATGLPVANLEEGLPGITNCTVTLSPEEYYSEITGWVNAKRGRKGSYYTEQNRRLAGGGLRALSFTLDDTEKADAPAAVKAKMGRMFGNVANYILDIPSWNDPSGRRWKPNTTLNLFYPSAMVYRQTEFLVRDVFLRQSDKVQTAALGLCLPGAFSGETPAHMPWEE